MTIAPPPKKTALILLNLGTPDEPTTSAVRRYLREFLSDQRVVEIPKLPWQIILNLFVLTTRPKRVAHAYSTIWYDKDNGNDSPMRAILKEQVRLVGEKLTQDEPAKMETVSVHMAMTYGNPGIQQVLPKLAKEGIQRFIIFPLYPQYSATSTGAAFDAAMKSLMKLRNVPEVVFIKDYHDNPLFIKALAESVRRFQQQHGKPSKLLMSFHGIPKAFADKGDPYPKQCHTTAKLLAQQLGLTDDEWAVSFQSRFGAQEWLKPYTDELLGEWGVAGEPSVQIMSPAFSADCLETLEELAVLNKENFQTAGGGEYDYIPALNTNSEHIAMLCEVVKRYL